jgi:hypothetical protein
MVRCRKKLLEENTFIPARKKKKGRKAIHEVVIRKVSMRMSSNNLLISRSSQSRVIGKRRMVNNEQHSRDVLARPNICSMELSQIAIDLDYFFLRLSMCHSFRRRKMWSCQIHARLLKLTSLRFH